MLHPTSRSAAVAALILTTTALTAHAQRVDPRPTGQRDPARFLLVRSDQGLDRAALRRAILGRDSAAATALVAAHTARLAALDDPLAASLAAVDATVVEHLWLIDAVVVEAPTTAAATLAALPGVVSVHADALREPGAYLHPLPIRRMTDGSNHRTDAVHAAGVRGAGVAVAVIDTGFDSSSGATGRPHRTFFPNGNLAVNGGGIGGSRLVTNARIGIVPADNPLDHGTKVAAVAAGGTWGAPSGDDGQAPEARIAGYAISDDANGFAFLSTMVRGWQQAVLDAARFGTKVANISYDGTSVATSPEQQAMDSAVLLADLFVAAMAGNVRNSSFYQGAANVLAVGSVELDTQVASPFTPTIGSLSNGSDVYPHLVASGQDLRVPTVDDESIDTVANGTSYSSAAVAGMAALFRSIATTANADETRAAILATTEDVSAQNAAQPGAIGFGYARADRLVALANGTGRTIAAVVTSGSPSWQMRFPVAAGRTYRVASSWSQQIPGDTDWADLDLFVRQNGRQLAASGNARCTNEACTFVATADGDVVVEVFAQTFETNTASQPVGVAFYDPNRAATITAFGAGCGRPGFGCEFAPCPSVEPWSATATFGNADSSELFGDPTSRTQVYYTVDGGSGGAAFRANALLLRFDDVRAVGPRPAWIDVEIDIGTTTRTIAQFGTDFDANRSDGMTRVFRRQRFQLPGSIASAATPQSFDVVIPFDLPFYRIYDALPGVPGIDQNVVLDVKVWGNSLGTSFAYPLDAIQGQPTRVATLRANSPTATTGTRTAGTGTVIALAQVSRPRVPELLGVGQPTLGSSYVVAMRTMPASTVVRLNLGVSRTTFGGAPLPLSLEVLGATGCSLLTSIEGGLSGTTSPAGTASFTIPVPADPTLVGFQLFHQAAAIDQRANVAGIAVTNGLAVTIGR